LQTLENELLVIGRRFRVVGGAWRQDLGRCLSRRCPQLQRGFEALRIGLVNSVVPLAELLPAARQLTETIAADAPLAVKATKEAAVRGMDLPLSEGLRVENLLARVIECTEDPKEGPRAFAERRAPHYQGR